MAISRLCQQKEANPPIGQAKCMKTIEKNLKMRTTFCAMSMKISILQADRASNCG
jgi:hypothetical protein